VFQNYALFPHLTVFENVAFGLRLQRLTKAEINQRVQRAAALLHIEPLLQRKPKQLSGGQRLGIGPSVMIVSTSASLFLFDEPLSNLDAKLRVRMRVELLNLHYETRNTAIYVTHDQVEAMTMADRIVILNDGKIEQIGSPIEVYSRPANKFVAGFIGSPQMNFIPLVVEDEKPGQIRCKSEAVGTVSLPLQVSQSLRGKSLTLGFRPEHVRLGSSANSVRLPGIVNVVEHLGSETLIHSEIGKDTIVVAKTAGMTAPERNHRIEFHLPAEHLYLFDEDEQAIALEPVTAGP
jgi:multiple sugar transport system ATP-binding protein